MRIVHTISGIEPESGGPTSALCGLVRTQKALGHQIHIMACWKFESSFKLADELRADGIDVTLVGPTRWPFYRHPDLRPALAKAATDADIIHIHAMWDAVNHLSAVVARELGKPYVWTPHGMLDRWNMQRNGLFKRSCLAAYLQRDLNAAALLHVATDFEAENVARLRLKPPVFVQGFGLDQSLLNAEIPRGLFRKRIGLTEETPMVLFLGRIQRGKGLETLVPAMMQLPSHARLVVAGPDEGGYRQQIDALIARHGLAGRILFVGMITGQEKLQAIRDADVLAAPSAHENFGIAVAEAIALGTYVAVSDQVGLMKQIRDHRIGSCLPLDPLQCGQCLKSILDRTPRREGQRRRARSNRARRLARQWFAWPTLAQQWIKQYSAVIQPR